MPLVAALMSSTIWKICKRYSWQKKAVSVSGYLMSARLEMLTCYSRDCPHYCIIIREKPGDRVATKSHASSINEAKDNGQGICTDGRTLRSHMIAGSDGIATGSESRSRHAALAVKFVHPLGLTL